jgi:hypothetical protein
VDLAERIHGAQKVVVARTTRVTGRWQRNEYGDTLIVSQVEIQVDETLKGSAGKTLTVDVEGGTVGGVTLRTSSSPAMSAGERAVFFLDATPSGSHQPHLKGLGILKLDDTDQIKGSSLRLQDIRSAAKADAGK